ncbi:SDR family oxidoreductase [Nocardia sp. NPDC046763]|uniref:SDR family oxidoreductase n=1 Tax=Nocardia sp. NPDC046763 TaxID=3155256 RepID=UPI0034089165
MARSVAAELAPRGIRVNAVNPGPIEIPGGRPGPADSEYIQRLQRMAASAPLAPRSPRRHRPHRGPRLQCPELGSDRRRER